MSLAGIWKRRVAKHKPQFTHWEITKYTLVRHSDGLRIPLVPVGARSLPACALAEYVLKQGHSLEFDASLLGNYNCPSCKVHRMHHLGSK